MSDTFRQAFGKGRPQGEVPQEPHMSAQEKMMMGMLKQFIPGFDLNQIKQLGDDIAKTVEFFRAETQAIHAENRETQRLLRLRLQSQGINADATQPFNDGSIQTSIAEHYSRG